MLIGLIMVLYVENRRPSFPITNTESNGHSYSNSLASQPKAFYKSTLNTNGTYTLTLYDKEGNEVTKEEYPKEPNVWDIGNGIIEISLDLGPAVITYRYYDVNIKKLSTAYPNSLAVSGHRIVTVTENKLIVQDMFDKSQYYVEFHRDFAHKLYDPVFAIGDVKFLKDNKLLFQWLEGNNSLPKEDIVDLETGKTLSSRTLKGVTW